MNKDVNIVFSCNLKYTLLILIFYFISFTEGFISNNRHGINVNHVFSPSSKCILSRKQNQHQCFLFNNTRLFNNTGCFNNFSKTTNTFVPNIPFNINDDIIQESISAVFSLTDRVTPIPLISFIMSIWKTLNMCLQSSWPVRNDLLKKLSN